MPPAAVPAASLPAAMAGAMWAYFVTLRVRSLRRKRKSSCSGAHLCATGPASPPVNSYFFPLNSYLFPVHSTAFGASRTPPPTNPDP